MRGRRLVYGWLCAAPLLLGACDRPSPGAPPDSEGPTTIDLDEPPTPPAPDVARVRAAARAAHLDFAPLLLRHLNAPGPARLWASFGLGKLCAERRAEIFPALASALALWSLAPEPPTVLELSTLANALGRCGTLEAEELLRSWLQPSPHVHLPELPEAAAFGLGVVADKRGRLDERSLTLLLDAAEREKNPNLLYPFGRLPTLAEAFAARTLDVAGELVTATAHPGRRHGILALGSVGPSATLPLEQLVTSSDFPGLERATAIRALTRLGPKGRRAIDALTREQLERGIPQRLADERWLVIGALLEALESPNLSRKALGDLTSATLPSATTSEGKALRRRLVAWRCRAAALLGGSDAEAAALLECDPERGRAALEAELSVLGRAPLREKRAARFEELLANPDPWIRQSALRLLTGHREYEKTREVLIAALGDPLAGTRATAARLVAAHPEFVLTPAKDPLPDDAALAALQKILEAPEDGRALETTAAALEAAGALGALTLKPAVEKLCDGAARALHAPAARALSLLGSPGRACPGKTPELQPAPLVDAPPVTVLVDSDLGPLVFYLDEPGTEASRAIIADRVKRGLYAGATVGAVAPGFALAWGDPDTDGYDDGSTPPLPNELTPTPLTPLSVSLSAFAPEASSPHFLVLVADAPQLGGERVRLGRAEGPLHLLAPGDELRDARLR